jgi:hypothetical protein
MRPPRGGPAWRSAAATACQPAVTSNALRLVWVVVPSDHRDARSKESESLATASFIDDSRQLPIWDESNLERIEERLQMT